MEGIDVKYRTNSAGYSTRHLVAGQFERSARCGLCALQPRG